MLRIRRKTDQWSPLDDTQPRQSSSAPLAGPSATPEHTRLGTLLTWWSSKVPLLFPNSTHVHKTSQGKSDQSSSDQPLKRATSKSLIVAALGESSSPSHCYNRIHLPDYAQSHAYSREVSPARPSVVRNSSFICLPRSPIAPTTDAKFRSTVIPSSKDSTEENHLDRSANASRAMNSSQVSLSASESGADQANGYAYQRNGSQHGSVGIMSPINQSSAGGANLSGLVCNVHRTTGQEPHALVGATTTILGDKLYVFGGRVHSSSRSRAQLTSDLYELDLIQRHWTKLETTGDVPPPRYFHSTCALGDTKLVCYGGMSPAPHLRGQSHGQLQSQTADGQPEVVVMSDIHIYDVATSKWFMVAASTAGSDGPQGRYAHCTTIVPSAAAFTSATAPHSAIQHNRAASEPHSGVLGTQLDGSGGAEMIVVGGQDSANNYIEQISVFNLRSLKWTSITEYDRKCGAYKSMVAPLTGLNGEALGKGLPLDIPSQSQTGTSMLIYSNYNFLDVKLELQVRLPDGTLIERQMAPGESPPGLRFPNGGVINSHFVVSGTYLTSSKHEYALWALDLRTLSWHRIDTAGSVFSTGSWNRGILWNRRNQFVVLGHRKRNLVDDYNHRRINFTHVVMVELEAFGLYDNPRTTAPTSSYVSRSSPAVPANLRLQLASSTAGGRQLSNIAEQLGTTAMTIKEMSDMELVAIGGERIPCNSRVLAKRWGPYFVRLMAESTAPSETQGLSDASSLRATMQSQASRNSALTITPSGMNGIGLAAGPGSPEGKKSIGQYTESMLVEGSSDNAAPPSSRPRSLYLPHMASTIRLLLYYFYNSSLPPLTSPLCSPHTLCSLLQMARPYQIDGLLEATVQRLHEVLDGRNAAAVFNAAAMAAGGGRATESKLASALAELERSESQSTAVGDWDIATGLGKGVSTLRVGTARGHQKSNSLDSNSTTTSASTSAALSQADVDAGAPENEAASLGDHAGSRDIWNGEMSSVIGLQKRGLRGLMEGRRMRERGNPNSAGGATE